MAVNVPGWTDQVVNTLSAYVTVVGVFPGRCMQISAVPLVATGNVWTPSLSFSAPRAPVTCGCPTFSLAELMSVDSTGAPVDVNAYQVSIHFIKTRAQFFIFLLYRVLAKCISNGLTTRCAKLGLLSVVKTKNLHHYTPYNHPNLVANDMLQRPSLMI